MSRYVTLQNIEIQNANCIAGLTYGFPAVTHFLGFVHALSKRINNEYRDITLNGCAIVCHHHQVHVYQPKGWGGYLFAQTRNPVQTKKQADDLNNKGKTPPIIEEGRMHLTISLLIDCHGEIEGGESGWNEFTERLHCLALTHKLAGGTITKIKKIFLDSATTEIEHSNLSKRITHRLLPGFVLLDRSNLLLEHYRELQEHDPDTELVDAWLDFSALKFKATPLTKDDKPFNEKTEAEWHYHPKPGGGGWLVPLMTGYKAISEVYAPGVVVNSRDPSVPFCFVEAVYGVGEWRSPHRITDINKAIWRYADYKDGWYLCRQSVVSQEDEQEDDTENMGDFYNTIFK